MRSCRPDCPGPLDLLYQLSALRNLPLDGLGAILVLFGGGLGQVGPQPGQALKDRRKLTPLVRTDALQRVRYGSVFVDADPASIRRDRPGLSARPPHCTGELADGYGCRQLCDGP
jgi:hypothetical protein